MMGWRKETSTIHRLSAEAFKHDIWVFTRRRPLLSPTAPLPAQWLCPHEAFAFTTWALAPSRSKKHDEPLLMYPVVLGSRLKAATARKDPE